MVTDRQFYNELAVRLKIKEAKDFVDGNRAGAVRALAEAVIWLAGTQEPKDLHAIGDSLVEEGERLRSVSAKYFEDAVFAEEGARQQARIRNSGAERCGTCGQIGEHVCVNPAVEHPRTPPLDPSAWGRAQGSAAGGALDVASELLDPSAWGRAQGSS